MFRHWTTRSAGDCSPKEEPKQGELCYRPGLPAKNFQITMHEVGTPSEPNGLNWRNKVWSPGKSRQLEFTEQNHGEEEVAQKEKSTYLHRCQLKFLSAYWFSQVCKETTQDQREKLRKVLHRTITKAYMGMGIVAMLPSKVKNLQLHGTLVSLHKFIVFIEGWN